MTQGTQSLRVALVHVADKGGGAERAVLTLHRSLLASGHDSRLFVRHRLTDDPGVIEIERTRPIPGLLRVTRRLERLGVQTLYAPWFRDLPELIGDADVVHLHSIWKAREGFADLTGVERLAARYPTVMTLHDGWMLTGHCACPIGCDRWKTGCGLCPDLKREPEVERDFTALNWRRKRTTLQRARPHVTAVSGWLKAQVETSDIFAGLPVSVVHNSVDAGPFSPGDRQAARAALGLPEDAFIVLLAGQSIRSIHEGRAQHAVVALNQLGDHSIHALLVGHAATDVADTLETPSHVVGQRHSEAEMAVCYQAADLTVVPSEYETFGLVAAESLFCGTPVLAFATGGLSDIIEQDMTGRLVPTGDTDGLVREIRALAAAPEILAQMRRAAPKRVRQKFNLAKIRDDYLGVYHATIDGFRERARAVQAAPGN